jgi:NIMA (never in mitosis gene a)-related kinase
MNEANILQSLPAHPNIIKLIDSFIHENDFYQVLELADSGDISMIVAQAKAAKTRLPELMIWSYFVQIASALKLLHDHRIMHRDLKPANIFLTQNKKVVKLGDFGLGRHLSSKSYRAFSQVGTPFYMSPEAIGAQLPAQDSKMPHQQGYGLQSDIWSLGCILYELAALDSPFYQRNCNLYTLGKNIAKGQYIPVPKGYSATLEKLIAGMIQPLPQDRPDINEVLRIAQAAYTSHS